MPKASVKSMTGFGRGTSDIGDVLASVEIRSVNQRHLRVSVHLPSNITPLEQPLRDAVSGVTSRGQLDVTVGVTLKKTRVAYWPDEELVSSYVARWRELAEKLGIKGELSLDALASQPELFASAKQDDTADIANDAVMAALKNAKTAYDQMRTLEGASMAKDLNARIDTLEKSVGVIAEKSSSYRTAQAEKLRTRIQGLLEETGVSLESVQGESLEREIAVRSAAVADRAEIAEEIDRMRSHFAQFRSTLEVGGPCGRKLDFISQELQREISTTGAKVGDPAIGQIVVDFKSELEKIREQVQNIE